MITKAITKMARVQESKIYKKVRFLTELGLLVALVLTIGGNSLAQSPSTYNGVSFSFVLTNGINDEAKTTFHVGENIFILTKIENGSDGLFDYRVEDENYLYRFDLTKTGRSLPIPYRSDKATLLSIREEEPGAGRIMIPDPIMPGDSEMLDTLKLTDRYESLAPGNYTLNIEYKTGETIESNGTRKRLRLMYAVSFQVVP